MKITPRLLVMSEDVMGRRCKKRFTSPQNRKYLPKDPDALMLKCNTPLFYALCEPNAPLPFRSLISNLDSRSANSKS
jgi:hypothetical protein